MRSRTCDLRRRRTLLIPMLALLAAACIEPAAPPRLEGDMFGDLRRQITRQKDVVFDIARKNDLGIIEVLAANPGLDPWLPGDGTRILLPTAHLLPKAPREGILVNVADLRLYYFKGGALLITAPIGIGRQGYKTPLGTAKVVKKQKDPVWYLTPAERADHPELPSAVPPGPDNPLGAYALRLSWPSYLIHGTNTPDGVGQWTSRGCIRMYPEDIERLYAMAPVGTAVRVVDQPIKLGWRGGELFLQAYPLQKQIDELSLERRGSKISTKQDEAWIRTKLGTKAKDVDWAQVRQALQARTGIPVQITHKGGQAVTIEKSSGFF